VAGGFDLVPETLASVKSGDLDYTIDQQPYLQGFLPVLQLFLYNVSGSLTGMADTNTGLKFLDKTTVGPYNDSKSRFEGTSSKAAVVTT
jgi:simple sugar transport system substrate-binding protein